MSTSVRSTLSPRSSSVDLSSCKIPGRFVARMLMTVKAGSDAPSTVTDRFSSPFRSETHESSPAGETARGETRRGAGTRADPSATPRRRRGRAPGWDPTGRGGLAQFARAAREAAGASAAVDDMATRARCQTPRVRDRRTRGAPESDTRRGKRSDSARVARPEAPIASLQKTDARVQSEGKKRMDHSQQATFFKPKISRQPMSCRHACIFQTPRS